MTQAHDHDTTDDGELIVPDDVYRQLEATRTSGTVNMLTNIIWALDEFEFDEAYEWVRANREAYNEYALHGGFAPESAATATATATDADAGGDGGSA